jgi:hypothetical protein
MLVGSLLEPRRFGSDPDFLILQRLATGAWGSLCDACSLFFTDSAVFILFLLAESSGLKSSQGKGLDDPADGLYLSIF